MFKENMDFFPTPKSLAMQMATTVDWKKVKYVLEPSAGNSYLIDYIKEFRGAYHGLDIKAIEIDNDLQAILRSKNINVIDSDFLTYQGIDQFDLIIANFPFSQGDKHLLKAINIMYSGQIVCIINAETIKNPFSNDRKLLVRKLNELNAKIKFIQNAFNGPDSPRKTDVEVALIHITIEKDVNEDLLKGVTLSSSEYNPEYIDLTNKDIAINDNITSVVREYNFKVKLGLETLINYYKNYKYIGSYMKLTANEGDCQRGSSFNNSNKDLNILLKSETNDFISNIRKNFWNKTLQLKEVKDKLTQKKRQELTKNLQSYSTMEFTESNVRQFLINLINNYNDIIKDSIANIFDLMTVKYAFNGTLYDKNIHYYNGWKTNKSFKVNRRVILPNFNLSHAFSSGWYLTSSSGDMADDIDKVMNYFDRSYKSKYKKIRDAAQTIQIREDGSKINIDIFSKLESEYFEIKLHKKGTCHLTFKDENILRVFNIEAGKRKGWLPCDYGSKKYSELSLEEKEIVKNFEDKVDDYINNENIIGFNNNPKIELLSA